MRGPVPSWSRAPHRAKARRTEPDLLHRARRQAAEAEVTGKAVVGLRFLADRLNTATGLVGYHRRQVRPR
ncbi:hypothetical protein [Streptomyces sp. NPDC059604]|uniref:hypothetical protein n=1 Tax=Streptomyces sp. NPDC059604 TaxID=3346881 RepID=UPI0036911AEF